MDKQELIALADALERLTDFETPEAVALNDALHDVLPEPKCVQPPNYLRSIDAAMTLVPDHCWVRMDEWPGGFGQARGTASVHPIRDPAVDGHCAKAETLPLALAAAAIRAIASQEGE